MWSPLGRFHHKERYRLPEKIGFPSGRKKCQVSTLINYNITLILD
jgi:hypothetical protein